MAGNRQALYRHVKRIVAPIAGAEFSLSPDIGAVWRVLSLAFRFATSAVVATRIPTLVGTDGTSVFWRTTTTAGQAASTTTLYCAYAGASALAPAGAPVNLVLPHFGLILEPGWALTSLTTAIDAGDQYDQVVALVQEIPPGPHWFEAPEGLSYAQPVE